MRLLFVVFLIGCPGIFIPLATATRPFVEEERPPSRFSLLRPNTRNPADQLAHADGLRDRGRLRKAERQYCALVRYWPNTEEAALAQYAYARTLEERGKLTRAFEAYEDLLETYTGMFPHREVLEKKFDIAEHVMTRRRGQFFFFGGFHAPERALPLFESIVENGPRWERAPEAQLNIARIKEQIGNYEEAVFAYERVEVRYPRSEEAEEASFGRGRTLYKLSNEFPTHQDGAETALYALALFTQSHPDSEWIEEARTFMFEMQRRIERIEFDKAVYYDRIAKRPEAALMMYERFIERFPYSELTAEATERANQLRETIEGAQG